jgi:hypothetical protein
MVPEKDIPELYQKMYHGDCQEHEQLLVRLAAQDMSKEEQAEAEAILATCPDCQKDLELFRQESIVPISSSIKTAIPKRATSWWNLPAWASLAAAAAILLVVFFFSDKPSKDQSSGLQIKGSWQLTVKGLRQGKPFLLRPDHVLQAGDRLGFFFTGAQAGYLGILYLESKQRSVIYPATAAQAGKVSAGSGQALKDGVLVEAGSDCGWIVGLYSTQPFSLGRDKLPALSNDQISGCDWKPSDAQLNNLKLSGLEAMIIPVRYAKAETKP